MHVEAGGQPAVQSSPFTLRRVCSGWSLLSSFCGLSEATQNISWINELKYSSIVRDASLTLALFNGICKHAQDSRHSSTAEMIGGHLGTACSTDLEDSGAWKGKEEKPSSFIFCWDIGASVWPHLSAIGLEIPEDTELGSGEEVALPFGKVTVSSKQKLCWVPYRTLPGDLCSFSTLVGRERTC